MCLIHKYKKIIYQLLCKCKTQNLLRLGVHLISSGYIYHYVTRIIYAISNKHQYCQLIFLAKIRVYFIIEDEMIKREITIILLLITIIAM